MSQETLHKNDLPHCPGGGHSYRHGLVRKVIYTAGARCVAGTAGAHGLIDEIAFGQSVPAVAAEEFQVWKLTVDLARKNAVLRCDDGNDRVVFTKPIGFTDFPLDEIRFYFTENTILLPDEH